MPPPTPKPGGYYYASLHTVYYATFKKARADTGAGDEQSAKNRAAAKTHRQDITQRLCDAVKLVATQFLRDEARMSAYFPTGLLQVPAPAKSKKPDGA